MSSLNVLIPSLLTGFSWGLSIIFDKYSLSKIDNNYNTILLFKFIIGGLLALWFYVYTNNKVTLTEMFQFKNRTPFIFILLSSFALFIGHYFFYKALSKTNYTTLVVLIAYVVPLILVSILSYFFLNEKINLGMVFSTLLCIIGIALFIYFSK